ncbi:MAG: RidA family protein [Orrella sp.]|jgi:enamine deaminase RidA (YjgF/YER057c/UK114 family)|uniref:RidA family protein n=1 Tax=Orrella sp. TaxID=1921583 RepID=UPI003BE059A5
MNPIERVNVGARLSDMAIYNGVAYLAGQVPEDDSLDITGQTEQVLAIIDGLLQKAGTNKSRILMAQIFVANMAEFSGMNKAWDAWVAEGNAPPRATIESRLANPNFKVEIVVTAAV